MTGILNLILAEPGGRRAQTLPSGLSQHDIAWKAQYQRLAQRYSELDGFPSAVVGTPEDTRLVWWLSNQRRIARGERRGLWTAEKEGLMRQISPSWNSARPHPGWDEMLNQLHSFYMSEGRWPRPQKGSDNERKLGLWLANQIRARRGDRKWSPRREQAMLSLPTGWDQRKKRLASG